MKPLVSVIIPTYNRSELLVRAIESVLQIRNYLNNRHEPRCLQVGGGRHDINGWLNGDLIGGDIYLDARRPLPFADGTFDYVFTEHFLEHLSLNDGVFFLQEAYRILKPGGVLRQSTPSIAARIDIYLDRHPGVSREKVLERHFGNHRWERPFNSQEAVAIPVLRLADTCWFFLWEK